MFLHADIWKAIDRLAADGGYSASGLAKKAGLDPTTFNKSKRLSADGKPRWPSTESISKILSVSGMTMSEFFALVDEGAQGEGPSHTVPVIGLTRTKRGDCFAADGTPAGPSWEHLGLDGLYALEVDGDSLAPLYEAGDVLLVSPGVDIRRGDRVLVGLTKGGLRAGSLVRRTAGSIELKEGGAFADDEIAWTARILWVSQ